MPDGMGGCKPGELLASCRVFEGEEAYLVVEISLLSQGTTSVCLPEEPEIHTSCILSMAHGKKLQKLLRRSALTIWDIAQALSGEKEKSIYDEERSDV